LFLYNVLDLNDQKILCLPSIYQFERTGTNLNHPSVGRNFVEKCVVHQLKELMGFFSHI
jgi:hypothetical protein